MIIVMRMINDDNNKYEECDHNYENDGGSGNVAMITAMIIFIVIMIVVVMMTMMKMMMATVMTVV